MDMTGGFPITAFLEAEHDRPEFPAKARTVKARRANTLSVTEPPVVTDNGLCAESVPLNERALIGSQQALAVAARALQLAVPGAM